ncbi:MAG: GNAT family N-acetyltransferase [Alphaproteobacteria bacterium]|nr:GNAT family N-acetyltransferase [Alphaproteobacteria bacterium]
MECREYCSEDYSSLKEMLNGLQDFFVEMDDEYRRFDKNDLREYLGKIISDIEKMDGKIFLVLKDGRIVGFIQGVIIEKNDLQYRPCREGWIGLLFVEEKSRGGNVGKNLTNKMRDYFRAKGCDCVKLFCSNRNTNAINFYQEYGFTISNLELKLDINKNRLA